MPSVPAWADSMIMAATLLELGATVSLWVRDRPEFQFARANLDASQIVKIRIRGATFQCLFRHLSQWSCSPLLHSEGSVETDPYLLTYMYMYSHTYICLECCVFAYECVLHISWSTCCVTADYVAQETKSLSLCAPVSFHWPIYYKVGPLQSGAKQQSRKTWSRH